MRPNRAHGEALKAFLFMEVKEITGYELSRAWFDFAFENTDKIKPFHGIIFFFAIEHCNRLGWKKAFGFPSSMALEATGIKSYSSYKSHFDDLVEWGFFKVHEYSKNQYSSNVIELSFNAKANVKALDKALIKHTSKQVAKQHQSTVSIDKQLTINNKPLTIGSGVAAPKSITERDSDFYKSIAKHTEKYPKDMLRKFYEYWSEHGEKDQKMRFEKEKSFDLTKRLARWADRGGIESVKAKPPDYSYASQDKNDMNLNAWEKHYEYKLKSDEQFRAHFGYELRSSEPVAIDS